MDTNATNATAVRDFVTARLAAIAAPPNWIVPTVATDIGVDPDAYQAVQRYTDTDAYHTSHPYPRDLIRRRLGLDTVWLQVVTHTMTLGPAEVKTLKDAKAGHAGRPVPLPRWLPILPREPGWSRSTTSSMLSGITTKMAPSPRDSMWPTITQISSP